MNTSQRLAVAIPIGIVLATVAIVVSVQFDNASFNSMFGYQLSDFQKTSLSALTLLAAFGDGFDCSDDLVFDYFHSEGDPATEPEEYQKAAFDYVCDR